MIWDNSISVADIISILALVATFITVVLIFVQRHDAAKPVLFIRLNNKGDNHLRFTSYGIEFDLEKCSVELGCFGNNLAKKVCIESYLLLDKEPSFYKTVTIKGGVVTTHMANKPLSFLVVRPSRINYEVINHNEIISLNNELRGQLLGMVVCGFDAVSQNDEKGIPFSKSCIILKMNYLDMYNKKYYDYFLLSFDISSFSQEGMSFSFTSKAIKSKVFERYFELYSKQNCCGSFGENYVPSYDRKD